MLFYQHLKKSFRVDVDINEYCPQKLKLPEAPMMAKNWPGITVPLTPSIMVFGSLMPPLGLHLPVGGFATIEMSCQES